MKIKIINVAILLITLVSTLVILSYMPDQIPVHFDFEGVADRWGSKYEMLIMPVVMAAMLGLWFVTDLTHGKRMLDSPDEKQRAEARMNIKVMNITFTVISVMFMLLNFSFLYLSYSQLDGSSTIEIDIMKLVVIVMGLAMAVMGNFMPKTKSNSRMGLRLPWTRFNDVTWQKSNRFAGIVTMIHGLISALAGIIFKGTTAMLIMLVTLSVVLPIMIVYAYLVYQDEVKRGNVGK